MKHDDIHIIKEILGGKSEQFEHILNRYSGQVFNLIAHIVPCKEDAEELTQDVFIKVFRLLSSFKEESSFSKKIIAIAMKNDPGHGQLRSSAEKAPERARSRSVCRS